MKELDADYQKENQRNLRKLILSIKASFGKLNILIAICDNHRYRDEVMQKYETELRAQGVECFRVQISGSQPSLKQSLQTLVATKFEAELNKSFVVTVLGASELLNLRFREEKSDLERFLFSVQWTREALRYFQFPIVLWVTQQIAAELAKQAPDFWSWRGGVLEFFQPMEKSIGSQEDRSEIRQPIASETVTNIAELQQQIENLKILEPDSPLLGSLYNELGEAYFNKVQQGLSNSPQIDLDLAIASLQQAIQEYKKADRKSKLAFSLMWLSYIQKSIGNWDEAVGNLQQSLQLYEELENLSGVANVYEQLGNIERKRGNWEEAERLYRQCLQMFEELGDRSKMARSWGQLGDIERHRGNWEAAERLYRQCLQMVEELGDRSKMASSWACLGNIEHHRGNWEAAERLYRQSLQIFEELGKPWLLAHNNYDLAQLYRATENLTLAQQHYETAHQLFTQLGAKKDVEEIEREWNNFA